jgi:DNA-binding PadR family transcriptional regulator
MHRHDGNCGSERGFPGLFAMRGTRGFSFGPGGFHFEFGDDRGRGGRGGGRGARRRMFESGELRLVLLKLIADEPRHGYDLIRAIEEMTGGDYAPSPGVIYPTLTLLQDMGLIEEGKSEAGRKPFQVTKEGRAHLEEKADEVEGLFERLEEHGEHRSRADRAPIKRAVSNVMAALWHKLAQEGADDERLHEVAEILDEAARKIERLK